MSVIENLKPEFVWKQFDEIRKIPRCSKHEEKIREYILDFAKKHGLETKIDKVGNVVVIKPASEGMEQKPTVVLQGHMDMVCEKNNDVEHDFSKDPIKLKKEGDILTADGTTLGADDGIGVATALAVLEDPSLKIGKIEALFTVDEETGLTGAFALESDMLTGKILLNLDSEDWGVLTVGCAGGGNSDITLPIKTKQPPKDYVWLQLNVSGLRGGHSGVDIHEQRANAIKLIARLVWKAEESLEITEGKAPAAVLDKHSQETLVNMLHALPHGVEKMSYDIPGLVQTSTSLAKVSIEKDAAKILLSSRSAVMTELQNLRDKIHAIVNLCGGHVEEEEPYPGWKPDLDSKILKLAKKLYKEKYGEEPVIEAIHAGLECGIIGEKYSGMEMLSIGPTVKYPHSPEEQVHISTVETFYDFVVDIIKNV